MNGLNKYIVYGQSVNYKDEKLMNIDTIISVHYSAS